MKHQYTGNTHAIVKYAAVSVQTGVENASPYMLIQMLLDGALSRIAAARIAIKQGNIASKGENISRAIAIIGGLRDSLDHKVGGKLAENLENLYVYMTDSLLKANQKNDAAMLDEIYNLLRNVKTSWDDIGKLHAVKTNAA